MNALQICHLMYWATEQDLHFWIIFAQYHNYFAPLLAEINFERVPGCDRTIEGISVVSCTIGSAEHYKRSTYINPVCDAERGLAEWLCACVNATIQSRAKRRSGRVISPVHLVERPKVLARDFAQSRRSAAMQD